MTGDTSTTDLRSLSDQRLSLQAKSGNGEAFRLLAERHKEKVFRMSLRLTGNPTDAEEVLQETFLQVHRKLSEFRGDSQFSTWLYRIATNAGLMLLRKRRRQTTEPFDENPRLEQSVRDASFIKELSVEQALSQKEFATQVHTELLRLPEKYRAVFVLCDLEELTTEEAAQILEIKPNAVRQRLHRARLLLRDHLAVLLEKP